MSSKRILVTSLFLLLAFTVGARKAEAGQKAQQGKTVAVRVDGLACPFCAYGLEKKLKKMEGVEKLEIKINDGLALLHFKADAKIDTQLIVKKVKEAGFTPKEVKLKSAAQPAQKITLNVKGMRCESCVARVTKALDDVKCSKDVQVNLEQEQATLTCTDDEADPEKFVEAVEALGFKASIAKKQDKASKN